MFLKAGSRNLFTNNKIDLFLKCVHRFFYIFFAANNLALRKPVYQSSLGWYNHGGPQTAVDGILDTDYWHRSCTQTQNETSPWLLVDLEEEYLVQRVKITNRGDCCGEWIA